LATPLLENFLGVMSGLSLATLVPNLKSVAVTVLELLAFNSHDRPRAHRQTDRQTESHTSNEHIISAIHFVHLAEIITELLYNYRFLPARRYASAGLRDSDVSVCLSVCPSGRLSHAGIVRSRAKAGS